MRRSSVCACWDQLREGVTLETSVGGQVTVPPAAGRIPIDFAHASYTTPIVVRMFCNRNLVNNVFFVSWYSWSAVYKM